MNLGVSYVYDDLRDYDQRCYHCGSTFWFREPLKGHFNSRRPEYHLSCGGGRVYMEPNPDPPEYIKRLLQNKHFMENFRAYNQMFAMTSFGAKIDESINNGIGPYVFKVSRHVYHWIGSLCPLAGEPPRFLQLYIYDMQHELENRMTARDRCQQIDVPEFKIRLYNGDGARGYELPTLNTLGAIVFDSGVIGNTEFDVVIEHMGGPPKRINKLHPSYMSLQFPLLFVYGQSGFHTELKLKPDDGRDKERCGKLFQQYVVGVFYCIEQNRLDFIRKKQSDIRSDYLSGLYIAISRGERDGYEVGGRIILPMSFTRGSRYMYAHYLDALAICRKLVLYTVEFQKSGLPHCDTLLWVDSESKIQGPEDVDRLILAEPLGESSNAAGPLRPTIDEIQNYLEGRFICLHEALWRILKFDIHCREPAVQILSVHLEGMQRVTFRDKDRLESVVNLPGRNNTTLTEWLAYNEAKEDGRHLTYLDFPSEFVWYDDRKSWSPCQNSRLAIGHLADFLEVQTVHDIFYPTCRAACEALGLLEDDNEWDIAMQEACISTSFAQSMEGNESLIFRRESQKIEPPYAQTIHLNDGSSRERHLVILLKDGEETTEARSALQQESNELIPKSRENIYNMPHLLFGGKSILLGGDFRQTLPVKKGASKMEIIASSTGEPDPRSPRENNNWIDIPLTMPSSDDQCLSKLIGLHYDRMTLKNLLTITLLERKHRVVPKMKLQT
ncbi:DNA helicase [Tanacetum coccineum]|uniref:ATP-dependent DNA helicase n=1 Tax=Tanacetum coccineum TaxID=301880 RepID=A0ABQ4Y7C2_9ASTR